MMQSLYKSLLLALKSHEEFETSSGKSKKVKFDGLLSKKHIPSTKTYTAIQRIYLKLLSTTCVKIHQITYVTFETISLFSQHNSSVSF